MHIIQCFMGMSGFGDWYRMKWLQIRSRMSEVWNTDWIEFMFNRTQKILENQIKGLANTVSV